MRILMLSWEYPPKNVGGLSNHVYYLSQALSKKGNEVHVITCEEGTSPIEENDNGVFVHRVSPYKIDTDDFVKWVMQLNFAIIEEATRLIVNTGKFDLIHAHDWLSAFSAKTLKWSFKIPLACTIHATEYGRNGGIKTGMQRYISSAEWLLTYEAWKVVTCSNYMRQQVSDIFSAPWDKIWTIPNGVDTEKFKFEFDWIDFRRNFAMDNEKIVFYVGRHVFEKGTHILIEAAPRIISSYNDTKFIIGGTGPMTDELKNRVRQMGIESKVVFTGYMNDKDRDKLYRVANVSVFPSLYEPFGIVALEAMAAGCPVVVSETGGLGEIVQHEENGLKAITGSSESLAINVSRLLLDEGLANYVKENGIKTVHEKYTWDKVADLTMDMYRYIKEEVKDSEWQVRSKDEIRNDITLELREELKDKVKGELETKLKDEVKEYLKRELRLKVEKDLKNELGDRVEKRLKEELKDKVEKNLKENLKVEVKESLQKELKDQVEKNLKKELKGEVEKGLKQELKIEVEKNLKQDLKVGVEKNLKKELKAEVEKDLKQELKVEVEKNLKQELKGKVEKSLKEELINKEKKNIEGEIKDKVEKTPKDSVKQKLESDNKGNTGKNLLENNSINKIEDNIENVAEIKSKVKNNIMQSPEILKNQGVKKGRKVSTKKN